MRLRFERGELLPRLAWCARLRRGDDEVRVRHGPWVETDAARFVAGAWDGAYGASEPDAAITQVGSSGRATPDAVLFASSTSLHSRLFSARAGEHLFVSNSHVFALVESGDELDPLRPFYLDDLLLQLRAGIRRERRALATRRGSLLAYECCVLRVSADLQVAVCERAAPAPPESFGDYRRALDAAIAGVLANAAAPERRRAYAPVASISRGYDSAAVAALAREHGCRRAITLQRASPRAADGGAAVAQALGLRVEVRDLDAWRGRAPLPEAEFCACPPGSSIPLSAFEEELGAALLLGGQFGDTAFSLSPARERPDLRYTGLLGLAGWSANEFLLRVGAIDFPPLFFAWQHSRAIQRISASQEMSGSVLGGGYDRPIARRIAEEAGVPRGEFGRQKVAGGHQRLHRASRLTPASRHDYLEFYRRLELPRTVRWNAQARRLAVELCARVDRSLWPLPQRLVRRAFRRPVDSFLFQWGTQRIRARYASPAPLAGPAKGSGVTAGPPKSPG
jgi:hypothetical protein